MIVLILLINIDLGRFNVERACSNTDWLIFSLVVYERCSSSSESYK